MLSGYLPIAILFLIAVVMAFVILSVGILIRPSKPTYEKLSQYECGHSLPDTDLRIRTRIRFYTFALLFILFDIETVFLFPWSLVFDKLGFIVFSEMILFILILVVGYIYAWKKGALEWDY